MKFLELLDVGNLGNLLLVIIPAVCKEKSSPFGDPNVCQEYGMAYASLSLAVGDVYLWSYVYNIVRIFSIPKNKGVEVFAESSEVTASSYKEALLPSIDFSTANDYEDKFTLPYNVSKETLQVYSSLSLKLSEAFSCFSVGAGMLTRPLILLNITQLNTTRSHSETRTNFSELAIEDNKQRTRPVYSLNHLTTKEIETLA
ncbi:hypothetical protein Scep_020337 [Stephania cephalantha]|uniref:Uncharacterized protein n=1 Tax=Stephania cephalantha TaxID=152367 RepID=A0AAP0ID06_9MAGN